MSADFIQLLGCDVPESSGGCCFNGYIQQHGALHCPSEPMELDSTVIPTTASGCEGQLLFFNCPEGTQRFGAEANLRLTRTRGFFFTRWSPSAVMGMPGLLFTVNDAGLRHANFFGPTTHTSGVAAMLAALRQHYFSYRPMSFQQLRAGGSTPRRWATSVSGNYLYDVPMRQQQQEEEEEESESKRHQTKDQSQHIPSHNEEEPLTGESATHGMDNTDSFIALALPLSATSALLAFRVSPQSGAAAVYSYAILHAPTASFDPQRAKALGVPPGPQYGELKKGHSVWIDDAMAPGAGRRVDPSEVKRATTGSRRLYVALVLDGDSAEDIATALSRFFGSADNYEDSANANANCNGRGSVESELRRFVLQWQPSLLQCDEDMQQERDWELTRVVHVQSEKFFLSPLPSSSSSSSSSSSLPSSSSPYSQYIGYVFANANACVREQAFRTARHHFCAALQREFSAFPTALAHRYHLHSIAPAQFPIPTANTHSSAQEKEEKEHGDASVAWPFFEKHVLVPASAIGTAKVRETLSTLRYPTYRSAVAMLSDAFRSGIACHLARIHGSDTYAGTPRDDHMHINMETDGGGALTFLGTGSAIPSKYRNVSGTFLEIHYSPSPHEAPRRAIVVLDFGEGNAGQLAMLWGSCLEARQRFFADLVLVFISHAHADHHLGLMSLLELYAASEPARVPPLLIVCPEEVHEFLLDAWGARAVFPSVQFEVFPAERRRAEAPPGHPEDLPRLRALCRALSGPLGPMGPQWGAEVLPVHHPANAHALLLRFPAHWEDRAHRARVMLFSGDTRPSEALIQRSREFARDEEIFICLHEATFGEGCEDEAVRKCHSTLPEALRVAEAMGARFVVLNHFSQRYPKLPGLMKSQLDGKEVDLLCKHRTSKGAQKESLVTSNNETKIADENKCNNAEVSGDNENYNKEENGVAKRMCFGFDFMRLSFASLENGQTARLTPIFVRLLEEYESWGVGTTKRLRELDQ